jgi:thiol-disulfide isomerase/thioredoxin
MSIKLIFTFALTLFSTGSLAAPNNVGDIPFDLVGKTLEGDEIKVSDYKGKVVIVSFWASWCGPCKKELPVLAGIQKSATPEKLQVISINIDEDRQLFKKLVGVLSTTQMKLVHDGKKKTGRKYGVEGIPHMVIIDEQGKVAAVHIGYGESQLPALINEINEIAKRN